MIKHCKQSDKTNSKLHKVIAISTAIKKYSVQTTSARQCKRPTSQQKIVRKKRKMGNFYQKELITVLFIYFVQKPHHVPPKVTLNSRCSCLCLHVPKL